VTGNGSGGGGGAGYDNAASRRSSGGGVYLLGQGANGQSCLVSMGGATLDGGIGSFGTGNTSGQEPGGGGGCVINGSNIGFAGGRGGVRIIWAGSSGITRAFPSTNTGDL
jgi:hypothetical protein